MSWLLVAIVVVPFVELAVLLTVGSQLGVVWTIALLVAVSLVGSALIKREGWAAWRRINERVDAGEMPGRELVDGGLILFAGALLLTPGFLTDAVGVLLLLPPTRAPLRAALLRRLSLQASFHLRGPGAGKGTYIDV